MRQPLSGRARARGSVLLTAIAISLFLFFLSVAMVITNRGDISLTLLTDRQYRARMAARGGAEYALYVMRNYPDWKARLVTQRVARTLEGSSLEVFVSPYKDPEESGLFWLIESRGEAGGVVERTCWIVEEVALGRDIPEGVGPYIFAYTTDDRIALLDPTMRWQILGTPPNKGNWLAARNGPLFTFAPDGAEKSPPPTLTAWTFERDAAGFDKPVSKAPVTMSQLKSSRHLTWLALQERALTWQGIGDPGVEMGRSLEATVDGSTNGEPHYDTVTGINGTFTYSDSEFKGPVLEWYWLDGSALTADGTRVVCHARHYLYQGAGQKNIVKKVDTPKGPFISFEVQKTEEKTYNKAAILVYDTGTKKWDRLMDHLQVSDPRGIPDVYELPEPDMETLGMVGGEAYTFSGPNIYRCGLHSMEVSRNGSGISKALLDVGGRLVTHEPGSVLPTGLRDVALRDLHPQSDLGQDLPMVRAQQRQGDKWVDAMAVPAIQIDFSLIGNLTMTDTFSTKPYGAAGVACVGQSVITAVHIRRKALPDDSIVKLANAHSFLVTPQVDGLALAVHDGRAWQLLPGGLRYAVTSMGTGGPNAVAVQDADGNELQLSPTYLAAAIYPDTTGGRHRFAVVGKYVP